MDRARWRGTVTRRVHPRLALGLEFNLAVEEVGPLATLFLLTETHRRPSLSLGTSSDRIGSPEGTASVYMTASKRIPRTSLSPYAAVSWSEWDDGLVFPFGASLALPGNFNFRPMYDGDRTHLMLSWTRGPASVTGLWIWLEQVGIAVSMGFGGDEE